MGKGEESLFSFLFPWTIEIGRIGTRMTNRTRAKQNIHTHTHMAGMGTGIEPLVWVSVIVEIFKRANDARKRLVMNDGWDEKMDESTAFLSCITTRTKIAIK
jgi:hypothetical protein